MDRYTVRSNQLTLMRDAGLARSSAVACGEAVERARMASHGDGSARLTDGPVLGEALSQFWRELSHAWRQAARRGTSVRQLKRMDRRILHDLGMERGQIREVVDGLNERKVPKTRAQAPATPALVTPHAACP